MRFVLHTSALLAAIAIATTASAAIIIDDHFDDGDFATNTGGTGTGFTATTPNNNSAFVWGESGTNATRALDNTNGGVSSLYSNDTFDASSADPIVASFTISEWSRTTVSAGDKFTRAALGITNEASTSQPLINGNAGNTSDGLWVSLSYAVDSDDIDGGYLAYVDGTTVTRLASWNWDDNGVDTPGATLTDFDSPLYYGAIGWNAADLTISIEAASDYWAVSFSSTDGGVVLPADASGTFSGLGLTNDLVGAFAGVNTAGRGTTLSVDRIVVEQQIVPEPSSLALVALGCLLAPRRKRG